MDDDVERDVLLAVLAGLGALALVALGVLAAGVGLLLMAPSWQRAARPVAVAVATPLPPVDTPTVAPTATPVLVALPVVAVIPESSPTSLPSVTPTMTPAATMLAAVSPTQIPLPPTATPTFTPLPPTETATIAPTATLTGWWIERNGFVFASDCSCDQGDVRNCGDFPDGQAAQACYLRCLELAGDDVHDLDRDLDGAACEWSW